MVTWDEVERIATSLPEVTEGTSWGNRCWKVKGKTFVWDRPLRKTDLAHLGEAAPIGEIAGVRVADAVEKQAVLDTFAEVFTIPHFDHYNAVLIHLDVAELPTVEELVVDAWLCMAPPKLAERYAADHGLSER